MKPFLLILFVILFVRSFSQEKTTTIEFIPAFEKKALGLNQFIHSEKSKDSLTIQTLRFYVSAVALYNGSKQMWSEANSFHLIDAEEPDALRIKLKVPARLHYNRLCFNLGIDSLTNAAGAGKSELDATKGMYWAWQSGYINFKLEGTHSRCKTRKHAFEFHLGGFRGSEYCLQQISLPVKKNNDTFRILTDVSIFLKGIDFSLHNMVLTPGSKAVKLSKKASKMFSIKAQP